MTTKYFNVKNGLTTGNIILDSANSSIIASVVTANNSVDFSSTSNVSLGSVSNIHISGGTSGYVLSTNGTGTLSWIAQSGGSSGSTITVDNFTGDGSTTEFTLSVTPTDIKNTTLNYQGAVQIRSGYSLNGANVVFSTPPASGSSIEVTTINPIISSAAGSNNQVQFNTSGNLSASANLTFNPSTDTLNATNITANGVPLATTGKAIAMAIVFGF